ncbi:ATP/GTP-binding protein [Dactylosporangium cerinum]|uniref:ATP/GTP-binding protein n=1 Tax=Dactylosporangium cerinum TaxID=1434730 RepID=A0ABV9WI62_9ACTN
MLLRFEVSNHRSIYEPVELSMVAVDEDRPAARSFDLINEQVLTVAGIYGPNASGKSNLIDALGWLSSAVGRSLRTWDKAIPRDPFRFKRGPEEPSTFELEMMVDGVRYTYTLTLDHTNVIFEGLYSYPERRRRILFEREGLEIAFRRGLGGISGTRDLLTPNTLALSAAMRFDALEVSPFGRRLASFGYLGQPRRRRRLGFTGVPTYSTERMFIDLSDPDALFDLQDMEQFGGYGSALSLLRFADLGIDNVEIVEEQLSDPAGDPRLRRYVRLIHRVAGEQLAFNMAEESEGTQTWYRLIGPTLQALQNGQLLLFDEIDASLHPRLSARLLELFQDPVTNPRGAQLIFTSHDTSLLNHLNRDEVWLTEKNEEGATVLTALAEYGGDKVRRSMNLERAYLQGRFGAVPEVDQILLRQALGIATGDS